MKTNIYISVICLTAIFSFLFVSCDDGDTTKPVINLIEPAEGDSLLIGDEHGIHFEAEFSDNEALSSYKIEIHNNFKDHGHNTRAGSAEETVAFAWDSIYYDISGKKNTEIHHHGVKIPENAKPGKYHLMVYCTDAAGNEANVARNIVLSHEAEEHHHDDDDEHED
jgi:hypothetical protein